MDQASSPGTFSPKAETKIREALLDARSCAARRSCRSWWPRSRWTAEVASGRPSGFPWAGFCAVPGMVRLEGIEPLP